MFMIKFKLMNHVEMLSLDFKPVNYFQVWMYWGIDCQLHLRLIYEPYGLDVDNVKGPKSHNVQR